MIQGHLILRRCESRHGGDSDGFPEALSKSKTAVNKVLPDDNTNIRRDVVEGRSCVGEYARLWIG